MTSLQPEQLNRQISRRHRNCSMLGITSMVLLLALIATLFIFFV